MLDDEYNNHAKEMTWFAEKTEWLQGEVERV